MAGTGRVVVHLKDGSQFEAEFQAVAEGIIWVEKVASDHFGELAKDDAVGIPVNEVAYIIQREAPEAGRIGLVPWS